MNTCKVVELSIDEAKDCLIEFYTDTLVNDRQNTRDLIRDGMFGTEDQAIPNFKIITNERIVELFGEFDLGREIAKQHNASHVVIRIGDFKWGIVFHIGNLPPDERWIPYSDAV